MSTQYIRYPAASSGGGVPTYANLASFPSGPSDGQLGIALDTHLLYEYNLGLLAWQVIGGANLVLSIGTVDSQTPSANGAVIASNALVMQSASASVPGLMSTAAQSFAGIKTFNNSILADGGVDASGTLTLGSAATTINIGNAGSVVNIQGTTIYENTPILQVVDPKITLNKGGAAGSGQNSGFEIEENNVITGYLETSASRNNFSMKAPATAGIITFTPGVSGFTIDQGSHNPVTIGTANGLSLSTQILSLAAASASVPGAVTTGAQTFAGAKTFNSDVTINANLILAGTTNSSLTGANARIPSHTNATVTFTNASLTSIASANNGGVASGHLLTLVNATGNTITIVNNYGGAAAGEAILTGANGDVLIPNNSAFMLQYNSTANAWICIISQGRFMGTIDSQTKSANGAVQVGNQLVMQTADASFPGLVSTAAQTLAGAKTFSSAPILSSLSASLPLKLDASNNVTAAAINLSGSEVTSTLGIGNGGTGATTQQTAINALTGTQTNAYYLRSNGTNASLSALAAADLSGTVAIANGGTGAATASAGFDALSPNTTKGDITVRSSSSNTRLAVGSDGQVLVADSSQTLGVKWATAAQGAKNYITYNNFENNATTGWSLSHTTLSSSIPNQVSGSWTSASGNLSMSVVSSGQLAGSYSLSLASSAATTAGDMLVSQAYTIDLEDQAKPLTFKFYYSAVSNASNVNFSGTSSNTYQIYIYDVANSAWIQPAGVYGMTQGSGVGYVTGTFQTPSNMTSFRIAIVCINASAGANTIYFDDFFLGPQTAPLGAAVTDWAAYTPTLSNITLGNGTLAAFYRRVGDSIEVNFSFKMGTTSSMGTSPSFSLPNGLTFDSNKFTAPNGEQTIGYGKIYDAGTDAFEAIAEVSGNNILVRAVKRQGADYLDFPSIQSTVPMTWANGDAITIRTGLVPISGWSSSVQMSNDTDTRVISAFYNGQPTGTLAGSDNLITIPTKVIDTSASMSSGTYTVPVAGKYSVTAQVGLNTISATANQYFTLSVKQNGTLRAENVIRAEASSIDSRNAQVHAELDCSAGDTITLTSNTSMTSVTYNSTVARSYVKIERLSGPSVIAASESINAKATTSSTAITSLATTTIVFSASVFDSHGCYSTSTGKYTVPISGKYVISGAVYSNNGGTNGASTEFRLIANQSGSVSTTSIVGRHVVQTTSLTGVQLSGSTIFNCLAGDQIWFTVFNGGVSTITLSTSGADNFICIERIGN